VIWLSTCGCDHCKGRGAVCTNAFSWLYSGDSSHVAAHARADFFGIGTVHDGFDKLPAVVRDALNASNVNVCSRCASGWVRDYGAAKAVRLIRDVRVIDDTRAVTPIDGWSSTTLQSTDEMLQSSRRKSTTQ
jgi:hypothetical protein